MSGCVPLDFLKLSHKMLIGLIMMLQYLVSAGSAKNNDSSDLLETVQPQEGADVRQVAFVKVAVRQS